MTYTREQIFTAIKYAFSGEPVPMDMDLPNPDEIIEFCDNQLERLAVAKEGAQRRKEAKRAEPDPLREHVLSVVNQAHEPLTASEVVIELNDEEASIAKVSNRLTKLVDEGVLYKAQAVVRNAEGKNVQRMVYFHLPFEDFEE